MNSGGIRGVTVMVVMTLVFAPVFKNGHWLYRLTGKSQKTTVVRCTEKAPCPAKKTSVRRVYRPLPKNAKTRCTPAKRADCLPKLPAGAIVRAAPKPKSPHSPKAKTRHPEQPAPKPKHKG